MDWASVIKLINFFVNYSAATESTATESTASESASESTTTESLSVAV
jgi:hypothetical protein